MKIYFKFFLFFFLWQPSFCLGNNIYSISVCTTSSKEDANRCKEEILKTSKSEAFILKNQNGTYSTYLGIFITYEEAKEILNNSSNFIKQQKPFIKKIEKTKENEINLQNTQEYTKIAEVEEKIKEADEEIKKLDEKILHIREENQKAISEELRKKADTETLKVKEEKEKALAEFKEIESKKAISEELRKKADTETLKVKEEKEKALSKELHNLNNLDNFENLLIKVDSAKNIMFLKGKNSDGEITDIKTYKVSTAKTTVKKPLGVGYITSISLNPQWNPTNKTLKAFKEKGINLPSIVPFGDKLNYMGAAKINLSHKVDGQEVYRIHGTLSENTIGTNESSGCIRMKNKEIVELATLLEKFSKTKNYNNISVILE